VGFVLEKDQAKLTQANCVVKIWPPALSLLRRARATKKLYTADYNIYTSILRIIIKTREGK
jgi:hypothetical protein